MQSLRDGVDSRLGASRSWVWGFVVVCVECKKVDREGYPVPLRALAVLLVLEPRQSEREVARRLGVGAGANCYAARYVLGTDRHCVWD